MIPPSQYNQYNNPPAVQYGRLALLFIQTLDCEVITIGSGNWIVDNLNSALETWNGKLSEIWTLIMGIVKTCGSFTDVIFHLRT